MSGKALAVGLTGGIGAGKSAVLSRFADLGAVVFDSDDISRDVVAGGTAGFDAVVKAFGTAVVDGDGGLDRQRIAEIVFADAAARRQLEAIVHPLVRAEVLRRIATAPVGAIVVNAVPLLVEADLGGDYDRIVVVEADREVRLERLARAGMSQPEALMRMAAQTDDDARRAVAWRVIVNDGSLTELRDEVDDVWRDLEALRDV